MTRVLPDPPSRSGHILTKRELDAAIRVLEALRRPTPATSIMAWDNDMQDMLGGLQRARYVETRSAYGDRGPRKSTAPFRPDVLATTDLGREYLDSIRAAQSASPRQHATRRRKTPKQLDREIAEVLGRTSSHATKRVDRGIPRKEATALIKQIRSEVRRIGADVSVGAVGTGTYQQIALWGSDADAVATQLEKRGLSRTPLSGIGTQMSPITLTRAAAGVS